MNILITGATGFVGSNISKKLYKDGHKLFLVIRSTSDLSRLEKKHIEYNAIYVDQQEIEKIFLDYNIDIIIHCATFYARNRDIYQYKDIIETNILFPTLLMSEAKKNGCKAFINTCSFFVKFSSVIDIYNLGIYMSNYIISKHQFREWGKHISSDGGILFVNMSLEHVYGIDDQDSKFVTYIYNSLKNNIPTVELSEGNQIRDFICVEDVAEAYSVVVKAIEEGRISTNKEFEIGTGQGRTLHSFVQMIKKATKSNTELKWGARYQPYEELQESVADVKAINELGWSANVKMDNQIVDYFSK